MSLPYREHWQLRHIDHALRRSDPHLAAMLAIFTRLAAGEQVLAAERLRVPAWRLLGRLVGGAVLVAVWAARGTARAARRTVAAACWLLSAHVLRRVPPRRGARPGPGTVAPGPRRRG